MAYLFDLKEMLSIGSHLFNREKATYINKKYNPTINVIKKVNSLNGIPIGTPYESIKFDLTGDVNNRKWFFISSFPGNCSSLVLSNVQRYFEGKTPSTIFAKLYIDIIMDFAEDICKFLSYSSLFVTTTNEEFKRYLEEKGFKYVFGKINHHSDNYNMFLVKEIEDTE